MNNDSVIQSIMLPHSFLVTDCLNGIVHMNFVWQSVNVIQDKIGLCKQGLHRASISPAKHRSFQGLWPYCCCKWYIPGKWKHAIVDDALVPCFARLSATAVNKIIHSLPWIPMLWSPVTRFANNFQSWYRHSGKSLPNDLTRDQEIIIHLNVYIILYMYWNY